MNRDFCFSSIEVEVALSPGLNQLQIMGLPDAALKESVVRIQAAFKNQGFQWPRGQKIIVNLKPSHIPKTSQGLELAIAVALLFKTKQIPGTPSSLFHEKTYFYGALDLTGEVQKPKDIEALFTDLELSEKTQVLTGQSSLPLFFDTYQIRELRDLNSPTFAKGTGWRSLLEKPKLTKIEFDKKAAQLLEVCALGGHSLLLAGPAGSGKSTLAQALSKLQPHPLSRQFLWTRNLFQRRGQKLYWRPFIAPHHSTPPLSMIGGGSPIFPGEVSRAHGGILFLDEYLEFSPRVQEALREPIEKGEIYVSRKGEVQSFPCQFQLIAATNLCPCGELAPKMQSINRCSYSLTRCRSTLERLSGPMLDRFEILSFSNLWSNEKEKEKVPLSEVHSRVSKARELQRQRNQMTPNSQLSADELLKDLPDLVRHHLLPSNLSMRRKKAVLRVMRSLADLDGAQKLDRKYLSPALQLARIPFDELKKVF